MLLTIDVGNTNISCGIFEKEELISTFRFTTKQSRTPDELALQLHAIMEVKNIKDDNITDIIVSSVVPSLNDDLINACKQCFKTEPLMVNGNLKMDVKMPFDDPYGIGADLIVDVVAGYEKYHGECLVVDFGTATKFLYINPNGKFAYCSIAPGLENTAATLWTTTAQLPQVSLIKPASILACDTVSCMQGGISYGYIGLTEGIINQYFKEIGRKFPVIATGGLARYIVNETKLIDEYDANLAYKGMKQLYWRNK